MKEHALTSDRGSWRWVIFVLSAAFALVATRFFFLPMASAAGQDFGNHLASHGLVFYAHAGGGAIALFVGAWQWTQTSRTRRSRWHFVLGRVYVLAIAVAGLAGLWIAPNAFGGPVARLGFAALAVAWLGSTALAFSRARMRDWTNHRLWMIRSFALTFAAVTLRIWLPMMQVAGLSFDDAYRQVAWLCWVPNLLFAEWLIAREQRAARLAAN
jgi:hypothetical protein